MAGEPASEAASFPARLTTGVALATLVLLAWLSWTIYRDYQLYRGDGQRLLALSGARGSIIHLDEVLTMSATVAATTGDTAWIDRYKSFEPQLTAALETAIAVARSPDVETALRTTEAANTRLVEMENEAFALVRAGQPQAAQAVLFGDAYKEQKQIYAKGMGALADRLSAELDAIVRARQSTARNGVVAVLSVSVFILATWLVVFQRVRIWRAAVAANYAARVAAEATVRKINEGLEATVADRTQALTRELAARQLAEKKLVDFQRMRAASQLTGGVAHEFNNLLTVVKANAEDLREELKSSPLLKTQADLIVRAADRGAAFVQQLLTFSRKQDMQPKQVDINTFLDGALGLIRPTLEANIAIEVHKAAKVPLIKVDPGQLESAVLNIVGNARDAMPGGGTLTFETAIVHVDAEYADGTSDVVPGDYVQIAVTDTGTGMSPEVLESAFVPFFTTKEVGDGTGLGLSTVHGFVTQSGGFVRLYSELGYGTSAKMYFPVAVAVTAPVATLPAADAGAPSSGARILVIEDDELVRQSVQRRLAALGYTVSVAPSADEALARLENGDGVDVVFSDVIMPGRLNGADLAREVRRRWPDLPILLTSGYTETTTLGKVNIPDGIRILTKPYANTDLEGALRAVVAGVPRGSRRLSDSVP